VGATIVIAGIVAVVLKRRKPAIARGIATSNPFFDGDA